MHTQASVALSVQHHTHAHTHTNTPHTHIHTRCVCTYMCIYLCVGVHVYRWSHTHTSDPVTHAVRVTYTRTHCGRCHVCKRGPILRNSCVSLLRRYDDDVCGARLGKVATHMYRRVCTAKAQSHTHTHCYRTQQPPSSVPFQGRALPASASTLCALNTPTNTHSTECVSVMWSRTFASHEQTTRTPYIYAPHTHTSHTYRPLARRIACIHAHGAAAHNTHVRTHSTHNTFRVAKQRVRTRLCGVSILTLFVGCLSCDHVVYLAPSREQAPVL